jgi:putative hemolysin
VNAVPVLILCATLLCLVFLVALACDCLKGFSRHRLDELCQKNNAEQRFLDILKSWETATLAAETVLILVQVAFVSVVVFWGDLLIPDDARPQNATEWFNIAMKWLGLVVSLIVAGVVIPRAVSRVSGEVFLYRTWPLIQSATVLVTPVIKLTNWFDRIMHRLHGLDEPDPSDPENLADEIRSFVDAGERLGAINSQAGDMIEQLMDLKDSDVASVMTPRTEMVCIPVGITVEEARLALLDAGHTRVPLIGDSTDDIVGILYAKDLLEFVGRSAEETPPLAEVAREAFYVPETISVEKLLETMNGRRVHMAVVLDEYGGVAGLVTMEDLLEEIVGEIVDEYDDEEVDPVRRVSTEVIEVDGKVHIDDLVEEFNYDLPEAQDYDTIGGFVFSHLGRIPKPNETFEHGNLRFTVLEADARRILLLRIERDETLTPITHRDEE